MKTFKEYLLQQGAAKNTRNARLSAVQHFTEWCKSEELSLDQLGYEQLMNYVEFCKQNGNTVHTIRLKINNLKHYYNYLISEGKATNNPAMAVQLKGGTKKVAQRSLSPSELLEIYALQTTFGLAQKRNKVLLSLVVFQGLASNELGIIEVKDVDLMNGTIYIPATRTTNSRTLELKPQQLLLFQDYLLNTRSLILKEAEKQSDYFLVHQKPNNSVLMSNIISILLRKLRLDYPKLKSLQQIRQSVITEWINVHGLRKAQYMAGHKYVSSTERYAVDKMEGLKKELKMHYVLEK